ncbi:MAG TPA: hypothetical protein VK817_03435 [Trebonia sp.]|jgi:hypothetical protein|nr:hypothetical protein [Trebonia sp.]
MDVKVDDTVMLADDDLDLDVRVSVAPAPGEITMDGYTTYTTCYCTSSTEASGQARTIQDGPGKDGYTTYTTCYCC